MTFPYFLFSELFVENELFDDTEVIEDRLDDDVEGDNDDELLASSSPPFSLMTTFLFCILVSEIVWCKFLPKSAQAQASIPAWGWDGYISSFSRPAGKPTIQKSTF